MPRTAPTFDSRPLSQPAHCSDHWQVALKHYRGVEMAFIATVVTLLSLCLRDGYAWRPMNGRMTSSPRMPSLLMAVTDEYLGKLNAGKELVITMDGEESCVAAKDIAVGDVIYSVPIGESFDVDKALKALSWMDSKALKSLRTGGFGLLALFLLQEKSAGSSSRYAEYLSNLPSEVPGVLGWSEDLLTEFSSSTMRNVKGQIDALQQDWFVIESSANAAANTCLITEDLLTFDSFKWGFGIVKAYNLYIDGAPILAPGVNAIQTDTYAESEAVLDSAGMWGGKVLKIVAKGESFKKGDEIVMNAGFRSAAECVEDLGTCPDLDKEDCTCELVLRIDGSDEATWDMYWEDKLNVLESAQVRPVAKFDLEADDSVEFDPAMIQFLRLKNIRGIDSFILESIFSMTCYETLGMPFSKENEKTVYEYLLERVNDGLERLAGYSSPEQDATLIASGGGDPKAGTLARLRQHERAALESAKLKAETVLRILEAADTNEYYQDRRLRELDLLRPLEDDEIVP